MSNQLQITGGAKVRNLEGVLTGTSGVVNALGINVPSGIPQLDGSGKILVSQLPNSVMEYKGTWNVTTNTPYLVDGTGNAGDVYIVEGAATEGTVHNFGSGNITFYNGDQTIYNGSVWQKASGASGAVTSVAITESGDALTITGSPITTSGTINIGFAGTGSQYIKGDGTLATFPTTIDQAKRLITEVYNSTGATLTKGTVVYINGGQGNLPTVTKAQANADNTSAQTYGVVQSDITNNNNGFVVVIGSLTDIDTQAYAVGTQLYLSGTTAGAWTSTKPSAPIHLVYVGIVVRSHPTQGVVEIRIQNGYELEELHDVAISAPVNNQGIFYNSSNDLWENKSIATALGYTPANDALVVHLAGTETITGAKTFSNTTTFTDYALMDFGVTLAKTSGSPLYASTIGYANLQLVNAGSVNSLYLIDGNTTKYSSLSFNNAADYSYTFPALNGTLALLEGTQTFTGDKTFNGGVDFNNALNINNTFNLRNNLVGSTLYTNFSILKSGSLQTLTYLFSTANSSKLVFNDAANYTYTFPTTSGTIALASDLGNYVTLATTQTITGAKIFTQTTAVTGNLLVRANSGNIGQALVLEYGTSGTGVNALTGVAMYVNAIDKLDILFTNQGTSSRSARFVGSSITNNSTREYTLPDASGTLALTSNLSSYVPYTGATTNVDLGSNFLKARTFYSEGSGGGGSYAIKNGTTPSFEDGYTILSSNDYRLNIVSTVSAATKAVYFGFSGVTATRTYTLPDASGTIALTSDLASYVPTSRTITINGTTQDLSANQTWTITPNVNATNTQDYTATAGQTTFTVTGGYTVGQLAVFYNGSKLASNEYTATNGTTFVLATACQANDIVQAVVSVTGGGIGGSGTTNYLSKWTASGVLGNSIISDNGSTATIGGALTATGQVEGTIINSTSNAFRLSGNNALSLVTLNSQSVVKINAAGFWGTQLVGANDKGLLIDNNGNAMIGTTTSSGYGNINLDLNAGASNAAYFVIRTGNNSTIAEYALDGGAAYLSTKTAHPLIFRTSDAERIRITSGGDVGIGGSISGQKLYVKAATANGSTNAFLIHDSNGSDLLFVRSDGLITTGGAVSPYNFNPGGRVMYVNSSGQVGSNPSTRESKININPISDVSYIYDLNPVSFYFRKTNMETYEYTDEYYDEIRYGFIADEVEPLNTDLVSYNVNEDGTKKMAGVEYISMIPVLVKALQEQKKEIEELKALINK